VLDAALIGKLFPPDVARQLREGVKVEPRLYDNLTILFSDISGFTDLSSQLDARDVQRTLDELYKEFDKLTEELGLWRCEIIGGEKGSPNLHVQYMSSMGTTH
jgi:class 3 adenylate cyclase